MLLRRLSAMRPVRFVAAGVVFPLILAALALPAVHRMGMLASGWAVLWVGCMVAYVAWEWARAGWLWPVYSLEWSPEGLAARFLWRSDVIPPGSEVLVKIGNLTTAVRSPAGRWYPLPAEVFDRLVEAVDDGSNRPERE